MTGRRTVNRLYDELSPAEAYGAALLAVAQNDWNTVGDVVNAVPSYEVVAQRSELMSWHEGFIAVVEAFDRALWMALADSKTAGAVDRSLQLTARMLASMARRMYLSGVMAASGDADSQEHQEKANGFSQAVLDRMQSQVKASSDVEAVARQRVADLVHGFDSVCQAAGIDPDVIVRGLKATGVEVLDEFRETPPSQDANEWTLCFAQRLLSHVNDDEIQDLAA